MTEHTAEVTTLQKIVSSTLGATEALATLDVTSPMVTYSLQTTRINETFYALLSALRGMSQVVTHVAQVVDSHGQILRESAASSSAMADSIGAIQAAQEQTNLNIATMQAEVGRQAVVMKKVEERVKEAEVMAASVKPLAEGLATAQLEMNKLTSARAVTEDRLRRQEERLQASTEVVREIEKKFQADQSRVAMLVSLFEIDESKARVAIKPPTGPPPPGVVGETESSACRYVRSLPAWVALQRLNSIDVAALEKRITDRMGEDNERDQQDLAVIRAKVNEKLDIRQFSALEAELREATRKQQEIVLTTTRLTSEMREKADRQESEKRFSQLENGKIDRGELVRLLTRNDIEPLEEDLRSLSKAFDSLCSKTNVEMREQRERRDSSLVNCPVGDPATQARLHRLEEQTAQLFSQKADRTELRQDVIGYPSRPASGSVRVPSGGALNIATGAPTVTIAMTSTPVSSRTDTPIVGIGGAPIVFSGGGGGGGSGVGVPDARRVSSAEYPARFSSAEALTSGHRPSLAPLHHRTDHRGSIPEGCRTPSPALTYTSSPPKYTATKGRYGSTATLFDSDGNPTPASVTAVRNVSYAEHVANVADLVGGRARVPEGHCVHEIPSEMGSAAVRAVSR